jgi:dTDP-4-dehydrorhamnose reductase
MKILLTGAKGMLGTDVALRLQTLGMEFRGTDKAELDITDETAVFDYLTEYRPDAVIHCAAYTAVDKAEEESDLCMRVNAEGTGNIAKVCREIGAAMMYISTDYVFDGEGTEPFETDCNKAPLSVYGKSKYEGELAVLEHLEKHYIVRISWVFGQNGNNFIKTILRLAETRDELNVIDDQTGSPTYTVDLAVLLCEMIQSGKYGTYHATNEGFCSWYDFAVAVFDIAGKKGKTKIPVCSVNAIPTTQYPTPAKRPLNSRLSKKSLDLEGFERLPKWKDAVERYLSGNSRNQSQIS